MRQIVFIAGVGHVSIDRELFNKMFDYGWRELFRCECMDPSGIEINIYKYYNSN